MSVATYAVVAGKDTLVVDVTSTADADTGPVIAHGMSKTPEQVYLTALKSNAIVAGWYVSAIDATNVTLAKTTTTASGVAGAQLRVVIIRPTHIVR